MANDSIEFHCTNLKRSNYYLTVASLFFAGPELEEQKLLILRKEIQIHVQSDITHESDQLKLQRCLREQLKTSAEAATILDSEKFGTDTMHIKEGALLQRLIAFRAKHAKTYAAVSRWW